MSDEAVKQWGLGLLAKAKEDAIDRAALAAYNEHFYKCTPSMTVDEWMRIWRKSLDWWTGERLMEPFEWDCVGYIGLDAAQSLDSVKMGITTTITKHVSFADDVALWRRKA